ncbi:ABC transporter permease [Aurantimonas sp. A2-1-M11]|uniref:ABC transporter permease n=1 Tax=Aurantimonas sp. A2-1-M11 TaxID=3113712 RepID=UPI002F941377
MLEGPAAPSSGPAGGRRSTVAPALEGEKRDGGLVLRASGDWLARTVGSVESTVAEAGAADLGRLIIVDCADVARIDTAGALLLEKLVRDLKAKDREVRLEAVSDRDQPLFDVVRKALDREKPQPEKQHKNRIVEMVAATGRGSVAVKDELAVALNIIGGAVVGGFQRLTGQTQLRPAAIFAQVEQMGVRAVPIIFLMSFLIGAIIAQQGAFQLRRFGGELYAVNLAAILVLREIGVLLTAIMIAGRSGSAITAEIGSMKMREEIDALHVIGLNPIGVLVFPRLVALVIVLPLLAFIANLAGLLGAMLTLNIYSGISFSSFGQGVQYSVDMFTVFSGVIKAPFMAVMIGLIASAEGMKVGGSAESLGLRVTASVVKSIFLVILMDGLFAIFYASIGL